MHVKGTNQPNTFVKYDLQNPLYTILLDVPVHLLIYAIVESAGHVAAPQCIKSQKLDS